MAIIVVAVLTQGFRVPHDSRGDVKSLLLVNSGFFQAVGVISFGKTQSLSVSCTTMLTTCSVCMPYVANNLSSGTQNLTHSRPQ
jgi:hypothetical protein